MRMRSDTGIKRGVLFSAATVLTVVGFVFFESWIILCVKMFGFVASTLLVTLVTAAMSWIVIYAASGSRNVGRIKGWIRDKEASLTARAAAAVKGGKAVAIINTTVFLGPIVASVLMLMLGLEAKRVYLYAALSALLCAAIWCGIYSGMFWGIHQFFFGR
jgi:hypothetical protein